MPDGSTLNSEVAGDTKYENEPPLAGEKAQAIAQTALWASVIPACEGQGEAFHRIMKITVERDPDTGENQQHRYYRRIGAEQLLKAQSCCVNCRLREACDERALLGQEYGIWAGIDREASEEGQQRQREDMELFVEDPGLLREAVEGLLESEDQQ